MENIISGKTDLYGLLDVSPDASDLDIKKAYRKKALKLHPDKNPDNPQAGQLFHQLSEAFKLLTDPAAKSAYDRVLRAKKESELRNRKLDTKRRKLKDELEAREKQATTAATVVRNVKEKSADELLKSELERLQKQGSQLLAEEQERIRREIAQERQQAGSSQTQSCNIKVTWKSDSNGEVYTPERLRNIFHKYGDILALVMSKNKKGALVEFANARDAELALSVERGLESCPLKLTRVGGQQQPTAPSQPPAPSQTPAAMTMEDFENQVLKSMREAQERKRRLENNS